MGMEGWAKEVNGTATCSPTTNNMSLNSVFKPYRFSSHPKGCALNGSFANGW